MALQDVLFHQGGGFLGRGKIDKGFVQDQDHVSALTVAGQSQDVGPGHIIAGGIAGIDQYDGCHLLICEKVHQVLGGAGKMVPSAGVGDHLTGAVRILLKGGAQDAHRLLKAFHQRLDQLRGPVAGENLLPVKPQRLGRQQIVDVQTGGVAGRQLLKAGLDLPHQPFIGEIGIDQITEIQKPRISPITAVPLGQPGKAALGIRKYGLGDIQILLVVDLVPEAIFHSGSL